MSGSWNFLRTLGHKINKSLKYPLEYAMCNSYQAVTYLQHSVNFIYKVKLVYLYFLSQFYFTLVNSSMMLTLMYLKLQCEK